jgi:protein SCO1/2
MCRADYSEVMFSRRPPDLSNVIDGVGCVIARAAVIGLVLTILASCKAESARTFPMKGQILAIAAEARPDGRREITVKHEDVPHFMPAMTMAYVVRQPALLDGLAPGDLFTATLVGTDGEYYLTDLKRTGHANLPPDARAVKILDVMQPGDEVPSDPLQDQTGATRTLADWRGRALAVTFVYTRCPLPDFCPLMDRRFGELQRAIRADARLRDRVHLVSVTFDPAHDTLAVIQAHARMRGADPETWSYLTGPPAAIEHFTSRFGVSAMADPDAAAAFTHNLRTAVIDRQGRLVTIQSGNEWTVDGLLGDLRTASGS